MLRRFSVKSVVDAFPSTRSAVGAPRRTCFPCEWCYFRRGPCRLRPGFVAPFCSLIAFSYSNESNNTPTCHVDMACSTNSYAFCDWHCCRYTFPPAAIFLPTSGVVAWQGYYYCDINMSIDFLWYALLIIIMLDSPLVPLTQESVCIDTLCFPRARSRYSSVVGFIHDTLAQSPSLCVPPSR